MNQVEAKQVLDKIVAQVFGYQNPLSLEQFQQKFAFDIALPQQVTDSTDGSLTWAQSTSPTKFVSMTNARTEGFNTGDTKAKRELKSLEDILAAWNEVNYYTTERYLESENVTESDNVNHSQNVYRSQDIRHSKNVVFCDGNGQSEFIAACQRSSNNTFCIRIDDAGECSNSFGVTWSSKITNCIFINDCYDMQDCMFCTNMAGNQYCIANMQFEKEEYFRLRDLVIGWLLAPPA